MPKASAPTDSPIDKLVSGVREGDRTTIGQALTLVESTQPDDMALASHLLEQLMPHSGNALRVAITGIPGAGKSTLIESLGMMFVDAGHKVAVLAIDPTSTKSGGSILGDKTRMPEISNSPSAFVRPSPTAGTLGGTTRSARESIVILEAAGYDIVFLETVGVGQSELAAVDMVDFFMVLVIPGAGDELQGIKRGIVELADMIVVNKADSQDETLVQTAVRDYSAALHLLRPEAKSENKALVMAISALKKTGLEEIFQHLKQHHKHLVESGDLEKIRGRQKVKWLWALIENNLLAQIRSAGKAQAFRSELEAEVLAGNLNPAEAAQMFIDKLALMDNLSSD